MDKVYKIGENNFKLINDDLTLKVKSKELLKKYFHLETKYTGDIDTRLLDSYDDKLTELYTGLNQCNEQLKHELSKEDKEDFEKRAADWQRQIDEVEKAKDDNPMCRAIQKELDKCRGLILMDIRDDIPFLKPLFKEILSGDHSKIDWSSDEIELFVSDVINDFFFYSLGNRKKS